MQKGNGKTQLLHGRNVGFDISEDGAAESELTVKVDAETESGAGDKAGIVVRSFGLSSADGPEMVEKFLVGGLGFDSNKLVAQADERGSPFAEKKVAGTCLEAGLAK